MAARQRTPPNYSRSRQPPYVVICASGAWEVHWRRRLVQGAHDSSKRMMKPHYELRLPSYRTVSWKNTAGCGGNGRGRPSAYRRCVGCWRALSCFKKKTVYAQEQDAEERASWQAEIGTLDASRFVFVDESSTTLNMARRYARAPGKHRAYGYVPRNYGKRTTLIASLMPEGIGPSMTLPGAADTATIVAYVEQVLCPALEPGQIVFMDNLSAHKDPVIEEIITAAGCALRWMPRYSPDYSPVELAFAKIKAFLRSAMARTPEALDSAITEALDTVTVTDAHGWFKHCGHALP